MDSSLGEQEIGASVLFSKVETRLGSTSANGSADFRSVTHNNIMSASNLWFQREISEWNIRKDVLLIRAGRRYIAVRGTSLLAGLKILLLIFSVKRTSLKMPVMWNHVTPQPHTDRMMKWQLRGWRRKQGKEKHLRGQICTLTAS